MGERILRNIFDEVMTCLDYIQQSLHENKEKPPEDIQRVFG